MTTVTLSFQLDEDELREDLSEKPETYPAAVLTETFFIMPVRFVIDDVEILALSSDPGGEGYFPLPLLGFCVGLNRYVDQIMPGVQVDGYLAGPVELRFLEEDGKVRVWCTLNDRVAYAIRSELVAAARKFRDEVRDWLVKNVPALRTHKSWTEWFPGATAYPQ
jgi:hypothetical protein